MVANLQRKQSKSLLNRGSGFLDGYSHTLNPYTGCSFGCSYCYVRRMPVSLFRREEWGTWVDVKQNAAELLRKELIRERKKGPVTIFMSSSTDPYQPVEYREKLTRSLLETMAEEPPDFLFLQTRSPLVTRDADVLLELGERVRVSMTVETDRDDIRRAFSPYAPPIAARLRALKELGDRGIPIQATVAPMLPYSDNFPEVLRAAAERICIDDYFMGDGSGGKRTEKLGMIRIYEELGLQSWYRPDAYRALYNQLLHVFPQENIFISQSGFMPG
ncbi:radical SAM protein [Paenibacillus sp. J5C_2022]|uniref:SPL family radical SAM protein n=1 Tax=Paenibacillus sp. J5C2022 TaxID=2977129 RepID=UPI0021D21F49|nr:radical SAM protein [Paenibacillus sp. J5C2022]MCU6711608.1 radical SAM protein [Paenibacillus sp. J5C2022]